MGSFLTNSGSAVIEVYTWMFKAGTAYAGLKHLCSLGTRYWVPHCLRQANCALFSVGPTELKMPREGYYKTWKCGIRTHTANLDKVDVLGLRNASPKSSVNQMRGDLEE